MNPLSTFRYIATHPLSGRSKVQSLWRFVRWQLVSRLQSYPVIYPFTERSKLVIKNGMTGVTGNLYCGLHEFQDMGFLLHLLRPEDLFVDIGANVGSYTVLASAHVGAKSITFEPVPSTFRYLLDNVAINAIHEHVTAYNMAVGSQQGELAFTTGLDTTNHVATSSDLQTMQVAIKSLDEVLGIQEPLLLKIDVEGFETEVIKGAAQTLKRETLKAIIIELNGSGLRYGFDEQKIRSYLEELGFSPYIYQPFDRTIVSGWDHDEGNSIYIRDVEFVKDRLQSADKIKILNITF